jgi:hypothetical protein
MSSRQPVTPNAMLCPHCMCVNDVAATVCYVCGSPLDHPSPGLAPLMGSSEEGARSDVALAARAPATAAANEPVHGESLSSFSEADLHRFKRVQVIFREDGSALLEYSDAPAGEAPVDEPTPAPAAPEGESALPTVVGPVAGAAQLPLPVLTNEPPISTAAQPSSGQGVAGSAGSASMTAFTVGAAVATLVLVCGFLVYRSLVPSDTPRIAAQPPPLVTFERPTDVRESARTRPERLEPPAARATPIASPMANTPSRQESPAPTIGSERPATSPAASPAARAPLAAPAARDAEAPAPRSALTAPTTQNAQAPAPRSALTAPTTQNAQAPAPPLNVPCNAALVALALCTPTESGRP